MIVVELMDLRKAVLLVLVVCALLEIVDDRVHGVGLVDGLQEGHEAALLARVQVPKALENLRGLVGVDRLDIVVTAVQMIVHLVAVIVEVEVAVHARLAAHQDPVHLDVTPAAVAAALARLEAGAREARAVPLAHARHLLSVVLVVFISRPRVLVVPLLQLLELNRVGPVVTQPGHGSAIDGLHPFEAFALALALALRAVALKVGRLSGRELIFPRLDGRHVRRQ
mmetsp:Transcript_13650/g.31890  ORF Transcript_13650/g.31890 Transcript_13650/m.31890 type:complete len:225 (-) Transcript_13650:658-1332(-)